MLFYERLINRLAGIKKQQTTCSILVGGFNVKLSKWCPRYKDNKAGQDVYTFATTSGYTKMFGQLTHVVNGKSCIYLPFITKIKMFSEAGVNQTIFDKLHHNIVNGSLNLNIPIPAPYFREVWDCKTQI